MATPSVVQFSYGADMPGYGLASAPIVTTAGNGIVVYAGWDLHNSPTTGPVPALYVADSAGNYWYHLGTSSSGGYGSRCSIWCCPNAQAVSWVSASLTAFASSLSFLVVEIADFPDFAVLDVEADGFVNAGIPSIQTFTTAGTHSWKAQPGVSTVSVQAWGAGGGGQGGDKPDVGGSGGGGGEYAAEPALAVTAGNSYSYTIPPGGAGGNANVSGGVAGGNTTFAGNSVTVTAHGGGGGRNAAGGAGGTGSSNTTHHNGGAGGEQVSAFHGAGGGSSGGPSAAGQSVGNDVRTAALAVTDGGPGGSGGLSTSPFYGYPPVAGPGGGGGGGGANNSSAGPGAAGLGGQIVLSYSVSSPVSLDLSATTVTADVAFTMIAAGAGDMTLSSGPSGWTFIEGITIGGANPDGMTIFCYWQPSVSAGTALTPSYTVTPEISISGIVTTVQSSPATPTLLNPNFPLIKVEIAEGFQPGDPTAIPPTWTDISSYCMSKEGDSFISVTYGQQYELATPEAGEMVIGVNNLTGAFTPGNPLSPFSPFIVLGMPVRVSAFWDGSWYPIGFGYVERWPQEWPDLPQWGLSKLTCTDSIAVLNSATMPSALQGAILADGPYAYFPCNEQYLTYVNGLSETSNVLSSYAVAEAAGLIASNASRTNQRAGMYCDSTGPVLGDGGSAPAQMETGAALNLVGDQGTGCGTSAISGNVSYATPASGPGMIYSDPNMPDPTNADGVTVEVWFVYDITETSGQGLTLFQAFGPSPSNYWPTNTITPASTGPVSFAAVLNSTSNVIDLQFGASQFSAGTFTPSGAPQQLVLAFPPTGSSSLLVYLNGALLDTISLSGKTTTAWTATTLGPCNYAYSSASLVQNYVTGHQVLYPYTLAAARVAAHYSTGAQGASGLTVSQGAGSILSWGYLGIPHGGPANFGPLTGTVSDGITLGEFYNLAGSSAADGLNAAILSDGGMMYAAPTGVLTVLPRWALFDQTPLFTFGDATDGSQVPFLQGQAFDFDNTYLYDVVSVQRSNGPTESITVITQNSASQLAYFTRSALQQQISTTNDLDAYTLADWELAEYEQPQIRVRGLTVNAASNPAVAFPAVLPATVSNVANVSRSPVGGVPITGSFLIQRVNHNIGPSMWTTSYQISPYAAQGSVLGLDTTGFNVIGLNTLA